MSQATDQEIAFLMNMVKDSLLGLARNVHVALADGKISGMEALMLATQATTSVMPIVGAFRSLSRESVGRLMEVLANSDLVFQPKGVSDGDTQG